jgi:hypothetical protein
VNIDQIVKFYLADYGTVDFNAVDDGTIALRIHHRCQKAGVLSFYKLEAFHNEVAKFRGEFFKKLKAEERVRLRKRVGSSLDDIQKGINLLADLIGDQGDFDSPEKYSEAHWCLDDMKKALNFLRDDVTLAPALEDDASSEISIKSIDLKASESAARRAGMLTNAFSKIFAMRYQKPVTIFIENCHTLEDAYMSGHRNGWANCFTDVLDIHDNAEED